MPLAVEADWLARDCILEFKGEPHVITQCIRFGSVEVDSRPVYIARNAFATVENKWYFNRYSF